MTCTFDPTVQILGFHTPCLLRTPWPPKRKEPLRWPQDSNTWGKKTNTWDESMRNDRKLRIFAFPVFVVFLLSFSHSLESTTTEHWHLWGWTAILAEVVVALPAVHDLRQRGGRNFHRPKILRRFLRSPDGLTGFDLGATTITPSRP